MVLLLVIILVVLLLGGFGYRSYGSSINPFGGIVGLLVLLLIIFLVGRYIFGLW
jgi:hypothetical protein